MSTTRILPLAATALVAWSLAACTPTAQTAETPSSSVATTTTTTESSQVPTTTTTPETTTPPPPPDLPYEGRALDSCADGECRVDVVGGDLLPVPEAAGGAVTILSVADGSVTMLLPSGTLITIGQGSRLTFGGCLITVLSAGADGAAIQLNGAA